MELDTKENEQYLARQVQSSSDKTGLTPLGRGGTAVSTSKENMTKFKGSMSPASLESIYLSLFQFSESYFFPMFALILTVDTL